MDSGIAAVIGTVVGGMIVGGIQIVATLMRNSHERKIKLKESVIGLARSHYETQYEFAKLCSDIEGSPVKIKPFSYFVAYYSKVVPFATDTKISADSLASIHLEANRFALEVERKSQEDNQPKDQE